jgi:hypothetical protein
VIFIGIAGALLLRAIAITAGVTLIESVEAVVYAFGALLLYVAYRAFRGAAEQSDPYSFSSSSSYAASAISTRRSRSSSASSGSRSLPPTSSTSAMAPRSLSSELSSRVAPSLRSLPIASIRPHPAEEVTRRPPRCPQGAHAPGGSDEQTGVGLSRSLQLAAGTSDFSLSRAVPWRRWSVSAPGRRRIASSSRWPRSKSRGIGLGYSFASGPVRTKSRITVSASSGLSRKTPWPAF